MRFQVEGFSLTSMLWLVGKMKNLWFAGIFIFGVVFYLSKSSEISYQNTLFTNLKYSITLKQ